MVLVTRFNGLIELGQSRTIDLKYPTGLRGDLTAVSRGGFRAALSCSVTRCARNCGKARDNILSAAAITPSASGLDVQIEL
jgi:hypothetical protein